MRKVNGSVAAAQATIAAAEATLKSRIESVFCSGTKSRNRRKQYLSSHFFPHQNRANHLGDKCVSGVCLTTTCRPIRPMPTVHSQHLLYQEAITLTHQVNTKLSSIDQSQIWFHSIRYSGLENGTVSFDD